MHFCTDSYCMFGSENIQISLHAVFDRHVVRLRLFFDEFVTAMSSYDIISAC